MTDAISRVVAESAAIIIDKDIAKFETGDVVQGEILDKQQDQTTVRIGRQNYTVSNQVHIEEQVGETARFTVEETTDQQVILKYISRAASDDGAVSDAIRQPISPEQIANQVTLASEEINTKERFIQEQIASVDVDLETQMIEASKALKQSIDEIVRTATDDDVKAIIQDNYNIDKITVQMFKALVAQNKIALKMGDSEAFEVAVKEKIASFNETFKAKFEDMDRLKQIVTELKSAQVPVTEKHIEKVDQIIKQYDQLKSLDASEQMNVLRNRKTFTLEEATKAVLLPKQTVTVTADVEQLDSQIKRLLTVHEVPVTKETVQIAKMMITSDIPLDEMSAAKLKVMTDSEAQVTGSPELKSERVHQILIQEAVENLKQNRPIGQIKLPLELSLPATMGHENAKAAVDQLQTIRDDQIMDVIVNKRVVSISQMTASKPDQDIIQQQIRMANISQAVSRVVQHTEVFELDHSVEMTLEQLNGHAKSIVEGSTELQFIKAKICVEELRLKMTYEAANRLSDKQIDVAIEPIEKVVEALRVIEAEQYKQALKVHQVEASKENLQKMEATMTAVSRLSYTASYFKIQVMNGQEQFTLEAATRELHVSTTVQAALQQYGENETEVRPDLGDRLSKTFGQIDGMLEELGLDVNDENTRLVKALARNEQAITIENIEALKLIDRKISLLTDAIKPTIIASMIKDQLTPVTMEVDQLLEYARGYEEAFLNTDTEKLSEAILTLKNSDALSDAEKESLIGIYRMLRTISKSKGAAASFLVKKQLPLNMKNLFEAAKYLKKTGGKLTQIQADIDDDFGLLKRLDVSSKSISSQIESALTKSGMSKTDTNIEMAEAMISDQLETSRVNMTLVASHHTVLESFFKAFSHEKMTVLQKEGLLEQYERPLLELTEHLKSVDASDQGQARDILGDLSELVKMDIQTLKVFEQYGFKATASQLMTHQLMRSDSFSMSDTLNQLLEHVSETEQSTRGGQESSEILGQLRAHLTQLGEQGLSNKYSEILKDIEKDLQQLRESLTEQGGYQQDSSGQSFKAADQLMDYQQQLFQNEDYYQIPMWMDGRYVQLNVYYQNHGGKDDATSQDDMDIYLFFETRNMGKVQSHMHIRKGRMQFAIYGEHDEDKALLMSYQEALRDIVSAGSYYVEDIRYDYFEAQSPVNEGIEKPDDGIRYKDSKFIAKA